jgi:hypothetical protein
MFLGGLLPLFHFLYLMLAPSNQGSIREDGSIRFHFLCLMLPPSNQGSIREDGIRNQIGVHPIRNQIGVHPTVAMEHARSTGNRF